MNLAVYVVYVVYVFWLKRGFDLHSQQPAVVSKTKAGNLIPMCTTYTTYTHSKNYARLLRIGIGFDRQNVNYLYIYVYVLSELRRFVSWKNFRGQKVCMLKTPTYTTYTQTAKRGWCFR